MLEAHTVGSGLFTGSLGTVGQLALHLPELSLGRSQSGQLGREVWGAMHLAEA